LIWQVAFCPNSLLDDVAGLSMAVRPFRVPMVPSLAASPYLGFLTSRMFCLTSLFPYTLPKAVSLTKQFFSPNRSPPPPEVNGKPPTPLPFVNWIFSPFIPSQQVYPFRGSFPRIWVHRHLQLPPPFLFSANPTQRRSFFPQSRLPYSVPRPGWLLGDSKKYPPSP